MVPRSERAERGEGPPRVILERETGFEPATSTLARSHSTTELFPLAPNDYRTTRSGLASRFGTAEAALTPADPAQRHSRLTILTARRTRVASSGDVGLM